MNGQPFFKPLRLAEVPAAGRTLKLEASTPERERIAEQLAVPSVAALTAELTIRPISADGYRLDGRLFGEVTRHCVVTLAPITEKVEEDVAVTLRPAETFERGGPAEPGERASREAVEIAVESEEDTEPYSGNQVDLGALLVQYVALALDPHPRAPGARFAEHMEDETAPQSPFAALERLKHRRN
ncbi:YceD family protein [Afifella pfennigii]|uniref:YceD family protein n=1 Tax=Afifella pfennigii TaxID=209897 RepID=UPI00047DA7DD|nr:DUF177 domain-containing protein [Afifella pfennigii]